MNYMGTRTFIIQSLELKTVRFCTGIVVTFLLWIMTATISQAEIIFEDVTTQSGITTSGRDWGASWTDFDSDGWPDFWASMHNSFPVLYINNKDGTFTNRINELWPNPVLPDQHGAAWADFDNDGDPDLLQLTGAATGTGRVPNQFLVNQNGLLQNQASFYGLDYPFGRGRTPMWLDWNQDGQLDVFIVNEDRSDGQAPSDVFLQLPNNNGFYASQIPALSAGRYNWFAHSSDLRGDGTRYILLHNLTGYPSGVFAFNSNPTIDSRNDFNLSPTGNARDAAVADFNNDLRPDIYIARQTDAAQVVQTTANHLNMSLHVNQNERGVEFQSNGTLQIQVSPPWRMGLGNIFIGATGRNPTSYNFTLSPTDPTVIGLLNHTPGTSFGLYIGFDQQTQKWTILLSGPTWNVLHVTADGNQSILNLNTLGFTSSDGQFLDQLLLQTDSGFVDSTAAAGVNNFLPCSSVATGDFDNDTDIDIYLACRGPARNVSNVLYENLGNSNFRMVTGAGGATGSLSGRGHSATVVDIDRDGFLDLLVTNGYGEEPFSNGPLQLFRNKGNNNHWVELDLEGVQSNRDAIGARVLLTAGSITQMRERDGGVHFGSQNHIRLHFGLGGATLIEQLVIYWPSGIVQQFNNLPVDQLYQITESTSSPSLSIGDITVSEGDASADFTVTLSPTSAQTVTVDIASANGSATAPEDFVAVPTTMLTFSPGETSKTLSVAIVDDNLSEGSENFSIILSNAVNATVTDNTGIGTILDNEVSACGAPNYNPAIDSAIFLWQDCGTGQWFLRATAGAAGYVQYIGNLASDQAFSSVAPFNLESGDVFDTSNPNVINFNLQIWSPWEDGFGFTYPVSTNVCFSMQSPSGATILVGAGRTAIATPFNLETLGPCIAPPSSSLSISDITVSEGDASADFTVTLSPTSAQTVTVDIASANGSAIAPDDYAAQPLTTLSFTPGQTSQTVSVSIVDDSLIEGTESFSMLLSNAVNATISDNTGVATILDNDASSCGAPSYDPAVDSAIFLWQNCGTGQWFLRATAGAAGNTQYIGNLASDQAFSSVAPFNLETGDVLDTTNPNIINFNLQMWSPWEDGFDFSYPVNTNVCFSMQSPSGATILVGAGRTAIATPFDLTTLGACN